MRKIIFLIVLCFSLTLLVSCNNDNNVEKEFTSDKLVTELINIQMKEKNEDNSKNYESEIVSDIDELTDKILNMSIFEFEFFAQQHKFNNIKKYMFVLFEKTLIIVAKFADDSSKIEQVKIFRNFTPNQQKADSVTVGWDIFELVEVMGYPNRIVSADKSLAFKLDNGEWVEMILNENMLVSEIKIIDFSTIENPTYVVDSRCGPEDDKPDPQSAVLIKENMTFYEITDLIGRPHKAFGSGAIWYEWTLSDGKLLQVMFSPSWEVVRVLVR